MDKDYDPAICYLQVAYFIYNDIGRLQINF